MMDYAKLEQDQQFLMEIIDTHLQENHGKKIGINLMLTEFEDNITSITTNCSKDEVPQFLREMANTIENGELEFSNQAPGNA